jgi:hypothetical protein
MIYRNILQYGRGRYFWVSLLAVLSSFVLYFTQGGVQPPNGGTWQGYVLGTVGALLIVWLAFLGVRKRSYKNGSGSLQGWTSAHVYLGTAVLFIASLHCAMQFGWNVHTLSYVLMCIVIFSGFYGLYKYLNLPQHIVRNRSGKARSQLFNTLYELDQQARAIGQKCHPAVSLAVKSGVERTVLGGPAAAQLRQRDASKFLRADAEEATATAVLQGNRDQQPLIDFVAARVPQADKRSEAMNLQDLLSVLCRRQSVLRQLRRDIALQGWLKVWLYFHIPVTIALIFSLLVHVTTTFIYW